MIPSAGTAAAAETCSKSICSICYEDLKPLHEDLQVISLCGHVFHQLCLQQWMEYCARSRKRTCPVCKQVCADKDVARLYFQSAGDVIGGGVGGEGEEVEVRLEVKRMEAKVWGLGLEVERWKKDVERLNDELSVTKEQLSSTKEQLAREETMKKEAIKQKMFLQGVLQKKSSELLQSAVECSKLQESNLALAKELAALKLLSDCNLGEDDILKLASLGNEASSQDVVDVLKKSLLIRNKNYKELMTKCNTLGRGEAGALRKLEKANTKIIKLKAQVKELELLIEAKDNGVLRTLKASNKHISTVITGPSDHKTSYRSSPIVQPSEIQMDSPGVTIVNLDEDGNSDPNDSPVHSMNKCIYDNTVKVDKQEISNSSVSFFHRDLGSEDVPQRSNMQNQNAFVVRSKITSAGLDACNDPELQRLRNVFEVSHLKRDAIDLTDDSSAAKSTSLHIHDIRQVQPSLHSKLDTLISPPLSEPGDKCFSGGLLGPDGSTRHLGKWCKRVQNNRPTVSPCTAQNLNTGSLIATGADGRGGRVKILRPPSMSYPDRAQGAVSAKKTKLGSKAGTSNAKGCFQMEHFFGKATS